MAIYLNSRHHKTVQEQVQNGKIDSKCHKNEDRRLEAHRLRAEGPNRLSSFKMERRLSAFKLFTAGFAYESLDL